MFPSSNVTSAQFGRGKKRDSRNVSEMGRTCGRGGRGGHGHGGNHNNRDNVVNGVDDISDPTRYFSKEEWSKLDNATHKRILDDSDRANLKKLKTRFNVSAIVTEDQNCLVASIINGIMNASAQNVAPPESVQIPSRHGSCISSVNNFSAEKNKSLKVVLT